MVREEICDFKKETKITERFCVLVLGGSQGAHSVNVAMLKALDYLAEQKDSLHFIHQTGEKDAEAIKKGYAENGFSADVQPFIYNMVDAYKQASLIICRAGATTLAEITSCGKASILIPFPHAAHNHQEHNARTLQAAGASEVLHDHEITGENLSDAILGAMREPEHLEAMEEKSYNLGRRDATEKVRQLCLQLLEKSLQMNGAGKPKKNEMSCF
jgi:UDP-N-acetylglucosamine--N-acetylmuramyl-(pentapeptide) pyrophosphoryl-undecaprenol N-acetylglucosamine transferase